MTGTGRDHASGPSRRRSSACRCELTRRHSQGARWWNHCAAPGGSQGRRGESQVARRPVSKRRHESLHFLPTDHLLGGGPEVGIGPRHVPVIPHLMGGGPMVAGIGEMRVDVPAHRDAMFLREKIVDDDETITNAPVHSLPAPKKPSSLTQATVAVASIGTRVAPPSRQLPASDTQPPRCRRDGGRCAR